MILTSFLILVVLFLLYLLWMPIILFIDTSSNQYFVQLKGLTKISVEKHIKEIVRIRMRVLFMNFYYYPLRKRTKETSKKLDSKPTKNLKKRRSYSFKTIYRLLRSFKIKRFFVDVDTGDFVTNAKLIPLFTLLNYTIANFKVNFEGRTHMALHMQNRPIHIIKTMLNT